VERFPTRPTAGQNKQAGWAADIRMNHSRHAKGESVDRGQEYSGACRYSAALEAADHRRPVSGCSLNMDIHRSCRAVAVDDHHHQEIEVAGTQGCWSSTSHVTALATRLDK
jgi:hypothetical protein